MFVGFDPDQRDLNPDLGNAYAAHHIIPKIVAGPESRGSEKFYLTEFPHCSSMLEPDAEALESYLFAGLFKVERTVEVETTMLADVMDALNIAAIDWLKIDTQGRDLSVIRGLDTPPPAVTACCAWKSSPVSRRFIAAKSRSAKSTPTSARKASGSRI